jgi:ribonuclease HI
MSKRVVIYTDGACKGNPGIGGWGAFLSIDEHVRELSGGELQTTNNRMELRATIEALTALKYPCSVDLYTDSVYVRDGVTKWLDNWKRNGWRTAGKQPVKNQDLWEQLDRVMAQHTITWHWVKGHSGDPGNERADALANLGIQKLRERML